MRRLISVFLVALAAPAWGEIVHLTDGTTLDGELRRTSDGWVVTAADGTATIVSTSQVKSIELKKTGTNPDSADQGLGSLRRAVANQTDVARIIERYRSFIAHNAGTPSAKEAEMDLAQWQDRLDKGLVKAGDQWVTMDQLSAMQAKALETADHLRPLIISGKLTEALGVLDKALSISPQAPALLYLKGVVMYRQAQLVPARTAFQSAEGVLPDHAATHNNLAVILWKQRGQMQALAEYDKAMLASPQDRTILDNVTEALHALPPEHQKNDLTKRVVAHYRGQEAPLEKTMAAQGQYRWGSQWLDEKEFNKIQAEEKIVKDKMDALKKDLDDAQASLIRIARSIQDDRQIQQAIANSTMQIDPVSGRAYQMPLPQRYFDLERDIRSLQSEQIIKQRQLVDLQNLMGQQEKNLPMPKYSGVQKAFDVEAMPGGSELAATAAYPGASGHPTATTVPPPATGPAAPVPVRPNAGGSDFSPAGPVPVTTQ